MTRVIILTVIVIITTSLSACSNLKSDAQTVVYDTSVDVPLYNWTSADTLFYPLVVTEQPNAKNPICVNRDYRISISLRYNIGFPLMSVPATLFLQQTEVIEGVSKVSRRIAQYPIAPAVRNSKGHLIGRGWGSLFETEEALTDVSIRFDQAGTYRILIIPSFREVPEGIDGMASMGIRLYE